MLLFWVYLFFYLTLQGRTPTNLNVLLIILSSSMWPRECNPIKTIVITCLLMFLMPLVKKVQPFWRGWSYGYDCWQLSITTIHEPNRTVSDNRRGSSALKEAGFFHLISCFASVTCACIWKHMCYFILLDLFPSLHYIYRFNLIQDLNLEEKIKLTTITFTILLQSKPLQHLMFFLQKGRGIRPPHVQQKKVEISKQPVVTDGTHLGYSVCKNGYVENYFCSENFQNTTFPRDTVLVNVNFGKN